jgi:O-antigen/teichoic acid export membrane protein
MSFKHAPIVTFAVLTRSSLALVFSLVAIHLIGAISYGYFSLVWSFGSAFIFMFTGINTALVSRIVKSRAQSKSGPWIAAGLICTLIPFLGFVFLAFLNWSMQIDGLWRLAITYCLLMLACILISLFCCAVLEGNGRIVSSALLPSLGIGVSCMLLCNELFLGTSIKFESFLRIALFGYVSEAVIAIFWMAKTVAPFRDIYFKSSSLLHLLKGGASLQVSNMVSFFLDPFTKGVLVGYLGAGAVTIYDIAMKMGWGLLSVFSSYSRLLLQLEHSDSKLRIYALKKAAEFTWVPAALIGSFCLSVFPNQLAAWMKIDPVLLSIGMGLSIGTSILMIIVSPTYMCLNGFEDYAFIFRNQLILAVSNIAATLLFVPSLGFAGAFAGGLLGTIVNVALISARIRKYIPEITDIWVLGSSFRVRMTTATLLFVFALIQSFQGPTFWSSCLVVLTSLVLFVREPLALFSWKLFSNSKPYETLFRYRKS